MVMMMMKAKATTLPKLAQTRALVLCHHRRCGEREHHQHKASASFSSRKKRGGRRTNSRLQSARETYDVSTAESFPEFVPSELIGEVKEAAARDMASRIEKVELNVPGHSESVEISFVGPRGDEGRGKPAIVMVHGFDSSCLEFRRLFPLLEENFAVYAVDVLGWGFTNSKGQDCGPKFKGGVIVEFIKQVVQGGGPVTMLGASLGGAVAIDVAAKNAAFVDKVVLVDAQGFQDGLGTLQYLPDFFTKLALEVLRSNPLRGAANKMSYFNKDKFATEDALKIGRLHCFKEDWISGNLTFIKAGGFSVSDLIPSVKQPTLIIWGDNDEILPKEDKFKFVDTIANSTLRIVSECGHVPHLEKPEEVAFYIKDLHDI